MLGSPRWNATYPPPVECDVTRRFSYRRVVRIFVQTLVFLFTLGSPHVFLLPKKQNSVSILQHSPVTVHSRPLQCRLHVYILWVASS